MKMKVALIVVFILLCYAIAYTKSYSHTDTSNGDYDEYTEHLYNESNRVITNKLLNKKFDFKHDVKSLEGKINSEYEIREDILRYIEKEIPQENEAAKYFAVEFAKSLNVIYYHSNEAEAIKESKKELLSMHCLGEYIPEKYNKIIEKIDKMMHNTLDRDKHMWEIDEKYFGWKVMGFGNLTSDQINNICQTRNLNEIGE